jgi:hypothetical protein
LRGLYMLEDLHSRDQRGQPQKNGSVEPFF